MKRPKTAVALKSLQRRGSQIEIVPQGDSLRRTDDLLFIRPKSALHIQPSLETDNKSLISRILPVKAVPIS